MIFFGEDYRDKEKLYEYHKMSREFILKEMVPKWNLTQMADTDGSESTFENKTRYFFLF